MNRSTIILLVGATIVLSAAAQAQTSAQTGALANGQASVQADKTQAQATGGASASSSASAQSNRTNAGLSSGTAFNATLSSPVDSKKSKPGDAVTARTAEIVKSEGKTVLPKGTKLVGHVTQASARAKGDTESTLAISFDRAILKNGQEVPLNVAIQAMASAQTAASAAAGSDLDAAGGAGAYASGSGSSGRGAMGGLVSTAGGATGSVTNTVAGTGNLADRTVSTAARTTVGTSGAASGAVGGLNSAGQLTSNSQGVFGMNGLNLNAAEAGSAQGALITSAGKNVHLESGTRMLLVSRAATSGMPNK
jgi:hypothetical protein